MQQLNPQDAMFAFMESPGLPMHIGWVNIYDPATSPGGKLDYDAVVRHVEMRLQTVHFFRQKLAFVPLNIDEPYWIDDENFDLENHVRRQALPANGGWRQFWKLVSHLYDRQLDFSRPLWEFHVIEGLDGVEGFPKGSFALLAKIHHAAVDGVSGVDVATSIHTPMPDTPEPSRSSRWRPETAPRQVELLLRGFSNLIKRPSTIAKIARGLPALRRVKLAIDAGELRTPTKLKPPQTIFSGPVSPHRVIEARRFTLDELKPLRERVPGASLNDVLLAVVGGAMRYYLQSKSALPDDSLVTACPVSLRSDEQRGTFGNRVGNMSVMLGTDIADPVARLRRIHEETSNAKGINAAIGARTLTEMSQLVPGALMGLATRRAAGGAGLVNTTLTNIPGPQLPLYLAGARLELQFAIGTLVPGLGIFHAVQSYNGQLSMTALADRDKMPDPEFYGECVQRAFVELRDGTSVEVKPKKAAKVARRRRATTSDPKKAAKGTRRRRATTKSQA